MVIGNHVPQVYEVVCEKAHISGAQSEEAEGDKNMAWGAWMLDLLSGTFQPILGFLAAAGIVKGLLAVLVFVAGASVKDSGFYQMMYAIGDGFYYFLPMIIAASCAKKFKCNPYLGMSIAASLLYPAMVGLETTGTLFEGTLMALDYKTTFLDVYKRQDMHWIDSFIFSSPVMIAKCLVSMAKDGSLFLHTGVTLMETLISFAVCTVFGLACALLLWSGKSVAQVLEPFLVLLNSLPKSALAPLLIVWLGNNMRTIVVAAVSVAVFGSILTLYTGFSQMDTEQIKLIYSLGGGRKDVLLKVLLPGSLPLVISNMKVNIGLCLVGVIIGEFIGARKGLGYLIIYGSQVFKLDWVIMSILILCLLAMTLYFLLSAVEKACQRGR